MKANTVPFSLREALGQEATSGLVDLFNQAGDGWKADVLTAVGDRFDRRLVDETSKLRLEMTQGFSTLRQEMRDEFAAIRLETRDEFDAVRRELTAQVTVLRESLATDRFELLKWAFVFWTGQFFALAGLFALLIRFLRPGA